MCKYSLNAEFILIYLCTAMVHLLLVGLVIIIWLCVI